MKGVKLMSEKILASKNVVVCINAKSQKTKSGLELANTDNKPETGEVVVIGTGTPPIKIKVGDTIVFRKYTDNRIFLTGVEYNFVQFKDVLGVIKK